MRDAKKKEIVTEKPQVTRILIDDFALRKGHTYGTAVTNADTNRVIDMIPSRDVEEVASLLRSYPNLNTVVRDGSLAYRKAIEAAHPGCTQISDRFHLVKNVMDGGREFLKKLPKVIWVSLGTEMDITSAEQTLSEETRSMTDSECRRQERANKVKHLRGQGLNDSEIGRLMGLDRKTVRKYCKPDFDPHQAVRHTCSAGAYTGILCYDRQIRSMVSERKTGPAIYEAIVQEGYHGSLSTVYRYIRQCKKDAVEQAKTEVQQGRGQRLERSVLIRCLYQGIDNCPQLTPQVLEAVERRVPHFAEVCDCVTSFRTALFSGNPQQIHAWLSRALEHPVQEIRSAARGVERDLDAVCNAVLSSLSNAAAEGNNTKIKLEKRIMYGRNSFELLRNRILLKEHRREIWVA